MDRFSQLCQWSDQSVELCGELTQVLDREREALIFLKSDVLTETTITKEILVNRLRALRKNISDNARAWYGADSSEALVAILPPHQRPQWQERREAWSKTWAALEKHARQGQRLLQHSGVNLSRLIENWRRLLGDTPLYTAQGRKSESSTAGRVFEAKY